MNTVTVDYYRKRNGVWSLVATREVENKAKESGICISPDWPTDLDPLESGDIIGYQVRMQEYSQIDDFSGKR